MLAQGGGTGVEVIVALSIFVPVVVTVALAWVFLRGKTNDPDEQRWRRLEEHRREAESATDAGPRDEA